jgi:hypothetical protein
VVRERKREAGEERTFLRAWHLLKEKESDQEEAKRGASKLIATAGN